MAARLGGLKVGEIALAVGSPLGGERGVEDEQQRGVRLRGRGRGGVRREGVMMMWCVHFFLFCSGHSLLFRTQHPLSILI